MDAFHSSRLVLFGAACMLVIHACHAIPRPLDERATSPEEAKSQLELTVKVPKIVTDVGAFVIELALTNNGKDTLSVVKDPEGPLFDTLPIDAWDWQLESPSQKEVPATEPIVFEATVGPTFIGAFADWTIDSFLLKPGPSLTKEDITAASKKPPSPSSLPAKDDRGGAPAGTLIDLKKGETKTIKYAVGDAYDFSTSSAGTYSVKLARDSLWITTDGGKTSKQVKIVVEKSTVSISGKLSAKEKATSKPKRDPASTNIGKRVLRVNACSEMEIGAIKLSATYADQYVEDSVRYLRESTGARRRYTYWFGPWNYYRAPPNNAHMTRDSVIHAYTTMRRQSFLSAYEYNCGCDGMPDSVFAYVISAWTQDPVINLCPAFWDKALKFFGRQSRASILVHEGSHFRNVGWTKDHTYDFKAAHGLAKKNPELAVGNANNFMLFSVNEEELD